MFKKLAAALTLVLAGITVAVVVDAPSASAGTRHNTITSPLDNMLLEVRGASPYVGSTVDMYASNTPCIWGYCPGTNQEWMMPGDGSDGAMGYFKNVNSGLCLETDGLAGDALYQWTCDGSLGQVWKITYYSVWSWLDFEVLTYAHIVNPATQLSIDIDGSNPALGARVIGWPLNSGNTDNQNWIISGAPAGY